MMRYLDVTQIEYNSRLINIIIKVTADNCVYNFYKRLTINLRIDIALFQLSIHSNMSLTFTLIGKSNVLTDCYFPVDLMITNSV